jgi:hypothetical protein
MHIQVSDVVSFGSLLLSVLAYVKAKKKIVFWLLIVVFIGALCVSIFSRSESSSPQITQSATASGSSTINQAGHDIVINQGVPEATVREILKEKLVSEHSELSGKYSAGYVIFGIANGAIVQQPYVKQFRISADWENWRIVIRNEATPRVDLIVSKLQIDGWRFEDNVVSVLYTDGAAVAMGWVYEAKGAQLYPYLEVIDTNQKIFAIGFSDRELKP